MRGLGTSLEDWRSITDVLLNLAYALDSADWETMAECLAPEVTWSSAAMGDHQGIDGWIANQQSARQHFIRAQHLVGGFLVDVDGDEAYVTSYVTGTDVHADDGRLTRIQGTYHDNLVRRDGRWLVTRRRFERVWAGPA